MELDPENHVIALCAAGMSVDGDAAAATDYFAQAWAARTDDFDAAIAAHYVARHRPTPEERLEWNARAVSHAEAALAAGDTRVRSLLASLYLNLGDGLLTSGNAADARNVALQAESALHALPDDGYRSFVADGIRRLRERAEPG